MQLPTTNCKCARLLIDILSEMKKKHEIKPNKIHNNITAYKFIIRLETALIIILYVIYHKIVHTHTHTYTNVYIF